MPRFATMGLNARTHRCARARAHTQTRTRDPRSRLGCRTRKACTWTYNGAPELFLGEPAALQPKTHDSMYFAEMPEEGWRACRRPLFSAERRTPFS